MTGQDNSLQESASIKIEDVFSEAFDASKGFKGLFWLALLVVVLLYIPILSLQTAFEYYGNGGSVEPNLDPDTKDIVFSMLGQLSTLFLSTPLTLGLSMLAVRRMRGEHCSVKEVYRHFNRILPLFITMLLMYLLISLGFILLIIPGVYLLVSYYFSTLLVVDQQLAPWQALESSRRAVTKHWFTVFLSLLGIALFNVVAMIPFGLGLIWSIPWSALVIAVLYQRLFYQAETKELLPADSASGYAG